MESLLRLAHSVNRAANIFLELNHFDSINRILAFHFVVWQVSLLNNRIVERKTLKLHQKYQESFYFHWHGHYIGFVLHIWYISYSIKWNDYESHNYILDVFYRSILIFWATFQWCDDPNSREFQTEIEFS